MKLRHMVGVLGVIVMAAAATADEAPWEVAGRQGIVREDIVAGAVEFHEREVREVMTPRPRIAALRAAALAEEVGLRHDQIIISAKVSQVQDRVET